MKHLLLFIMLSTASCSYVTIEDPKTLPTAEEQEMIDEVLDDLELRFSELGLEFDFREIPIFVIDDPSSGRSDIAGLCRYNKRIIIAKDLFEPRKFRKGKVPWLWSTILHEIGHCYFNRGHDESLILSDKSKVFVFESDHYKKDEFVYACRVPGTIMAPSISPWRQMLPEEFKDFYVNEMSNYRDPSLSFDDESVKELPFHIEKETAEENGYEERDYFGDCTESSITE